MKAVVETIVIELKDHEGRGDIRITRDSGSLFIEVELADVGGTVWETVAEYDDTAAGLGKAMSALAEVIQINVDNEFYAE